LSLAFDPWALPTATESIPCGDVGFSYLIAWSVTEGAQRSTGILPVIQHEQDAHATKYRRQLACDLPARYRERFRTCWERGHPVRILAQ